MEPIYHSFLTIPILSLLNGIILLLGFYQFGGLLQKKFEINVIIKNVSNPEYQNILVGVIFSTIILFPICLFFEKSNLILKFFSYVLFIFGLIRIIKNFDIFKYNFFSNYKNFTNKNLKFDYVLFIIIFFGLALLSFAPVTSADSLDYHLFTSKYLINNGSFPLYLTNFHSSYLTGSGEVLIALGLAVGSEQFGSILQYAGLISLLGILKKNKASYIFYIALFTSPVLIFFVSSIKPQLFTICSLVLVFSLIFKKENNYNNFNNHEIKKLIFITVIILTSITVKFSFILSASLLFSTFVLKNLKILKLTKILQIFSILFFIIIFPLIMWKFINFGGNFYELFYSPFSTERYGLNYFKMYLTILSEGNFHWFLFPKNFSNFTNSLGLGTLIIYYLYKIESYEKIYLIIIIVIFVLITYFFGQFKARFFLEPYMWVVIFLSKYNKLIKVNSIYSYVLRIQGIIFSGVLIFSIFNLTTGVINAELRNKVLEKNANDYKFYKWVNSVITDSNIPLISFNRSISFSNNFVISKDHILFVNLSNPLAIDYINEIKKINPQYIVYSEKNLLYKKYLKCMKKLYKFEKNVDQLAVRNPFSSNDKKFDAFIYEIDVDLLPGCIEPNDIDANARPR